MANLLQPGVLNDALVLLGLAAGVLAVVMLLRRAIHRQGWYNDAAKRLKRDETRR